jgi:hypothetical protein
MAEGEGQPPPPAGGGWKRVACQAPGTNQQVRGVYKVEAGDGDGSGQRTCVLWSVVDLALALCKRSKRFGKTAAENRDPAALLVKMFYLADGAGAVEQGRRGGCLRGEKHAFGGDAQVSTITEWGVSVFVWDVINHRESSICGLVHGSDGLAIIRYVVHPRDLASRSGFLSYNNGVWSNLTTKSVRNWYRQGLTRYLCSHFRND